MARKMITREITSTNVKAAKMVVANGVPQVEKIEDTVLVGNVSLEKAIKEMKKIHGEGITVLEILPNTQSYEIPVDVFLKYATIKEKVVAKEAE